MKKLYNKMINTMNSVSRKAVGTVNTMAFSARTALRRGLHRHRREDPDCRGAWRPAAGWPVHPVR